MQRQTYDTLRGGSVARLRKYRQRRDKSAESIRKNYAPDVAERMLSQPFWNLFGRRYSWMGAAHGLNIGAEYKARGYVSAPWELVDAWRDVGDVSDILERSRAYPGAYYSDAHRDETYTGHVWQLPARDGSPQYVAGFVEDQSGDRHASGYVGLSCDASGLELFDDKEEAARAADGLAERAAEKAREYDERWHEASQENDKRDAARSELKQAHALARRYVAALRELRGNANADTARDVIEDALDGARGAMLAAIRDVREAGERIAALGMTGEF